MVRRNGLSNLRVECLPAILHNRPEKIPAAVRSKLETTAGDYDQVYVAYGDCGTGGMLDRVLEEFGVERLPGAHCYQFYAGLDQFDLMHEDEPATFYLTDYLTRHFERLVWQGLGLDRHPELLEDYFGNYRQVVYLAQTESPDLVEAARMAADRLGLAFETRLVGYGELERELVTIGSNTGSIEGGRPPSNPPIGQAVRVAGWDMHHTRTGDPEGATAIEPRDHQPARTGDPEGTTAIEPRDATGARP